MLWYTELPKKKKSGFTLIEMIIVLGVVSVLFILIRSSFQSPNIYKSESYNCVQYAHSFMQSFIYAGLTQKWLPESWWLIFPDTYSIYINPSQQEIQLQYDATPYDTFLISWSIQQWCRNNSYQVQMTWSSYTIQIENGSMSASDFTGNINFLFCANGEECIPLGAIRFDTRTQQLYKHQCNGTWSIFCP